MFVGLNGRSVCLDELVPESWAVGEDGCGLKPILVIAALDLPQDEGSEGPALFLCWLDANSAQKAERGAAVTATSDGAFQQPVDPGLVGVPTHEGSNPGRDSPPIGICGRELQ